MARTRRPLIAGNWKMNGLKADALALAKGVADGVGQAKWSDREVLVCPPATLIMAIVEAVKGSGLLVGGQNCHAQANGAHTGDVAAEMLRDAGLHACDRRPFRAAHRLRRDRRQGAGESRSGLAGRVAADRLHRRDPRRTRRREDLVGARKPAQGQRSRRRHGGEAGRGLRAGMGDRHWQDADHARSGGRARPYPQGVGRG